MIKTPEDFTVAYVVSERPEGTEAENTVQSFFEIAAEQPEGTGAGQGSPKPDKQVITVEPATYINSLAVEASGRTKDGDFLNDGTKLKLDCGKLELATREGLGSHEAAHEDAYGIQQLQEIVTASGRRHSGVYRVAGTYMFPADEEFDEEKHGTTSGFHHNYLIPRTITSGKNLELLVHVLGSHLASRVWAWGGTLRPEGFVLSQKMWGIGAPVGIGYRDRTNQGKKPLAAILTSEDEDVIGSDSGWARFEDRSPDPSFSVEITELTLATTSLALRLVEQAHRLEKNGVSGRERLMNALALADQVDAAKTFAGDLTLQKKVETKNGEMVTALDIQERLARFAIELSQKVMLPLDEELAAKAWLKRVQALRECAPDRGVYTAEIMGGTNFAPRHRMLLKRFDLDQLSVSNEKAALLNLNWDRILPEGLGLKYWRAWYEARDKAWPSKPKPPRTRAAVRERLLTEGHVTYANWNYVVQNGTRKFTKDPFEAEGYTTEY